MFPQFTEEEQEIAEEKLTEYLKIVVEIYERIQNEPKEYAKLEQELAKLRAIRKYDL